MPKETKQKIIEILEKSKPINPLYEPNYEFWANQILELFPDREEMVKRLKGEKVDISFKSEEAKMNKYVHNQAIDLAIKIIKGE